MTDIKELLTNWTGPKVLMTIYPHPDDETMGAAGLIMAAKALGWQIIVVTLTKGGAGQIHIPAKGKTLKQIREQELTRALRVLGVNNFELGDFSDGRLREEESLWRKWVADKIDLYKPGIVVTYDHSGITGHPDHIVLSLAVTELAKNSLLLWNTLPANLTKRVANPEVIDTITSPTMTLDLHSNWLKKWQAARAHKSQALGKELPVPLWLALAKYHYEWYHQVSASSNYQYKFVDFKI